MLWYAQSDRRQLHLDLGVEEPFRPSEKPHPAFGCGVLGELVRRLEAGGHGVQWDEELAPRRRFHREDPFGNRVEFIEP